MAARRDWDLQFKTYIWENVLVDYGSGLVVALGRTRKEALKAVRENAGKSAFEECSKVDPIVLNPDRLKAPRAFHVYGGG